MPSISPRYGTFFSSSTKAWLARIGLEKHLFFLPSFLKTSHMSLQLEDDSKKKMQGKETHHFNFLLSRTIVPYPCTRTLLLHTKVPYPCALTLKFLYVKVLGIRCAMVRSQCAITKCGNRVLMCNDLCNKGINGKQSTQIMYVKGCGL